VSLIHTGAIGLLHPGEMGAAVGGVLAAEHPVWWASSGRSPASARRASAAGLIDVGSVEAIRDGCDLIVSICPPEAAPDVARQVSGFRGVYLDANAIAPATAREVAALVEAGGGRYLDGGIIGGPPTPGSRGTRLYLSGPHGPKISELFSGTAVDARVLSDDPTAASALKMCFAAWTKGTTALLLDIRALAETLGETDALLTEWEGSMPELKDRSLVAAKQAVTKGWRWRAEMEEIARTFRDAALPDGFHKAAAEIYGALIRDEEAESAPGTLDEVIEALRHANAGPDPHPIASPSALAP
jgi:3-hydroxyisobutyrate dehydrogenase-like beta-hydroxyacid dehydrogenase